MPSQHGVIILELALDALPAVHCYKATSQRQRLGTVMDGQWPAWASPPQDDDSGGSLERLSSSPQQELGRMHNPGRIYDGGIFAAPPRLSVLVQPQVQVVDPDLHIACSNPSALAMSLAITGMHAPAHISSA